MVQLTFINIKPQLLLYAGIEGEDSEDDKHKER